MAVNAPRATPIIWAPIPIRPVFNVSIATLYPTPTSPTTFAAGTSQPSRISSHVLEARMPSLSSFLPTEKPLNPRSTAKAVMPLYPFVKSVFAKMMKSPASAPFVIHSLRPSSSHVSPCRMARV